MRVCMSCTGRCSTRANPRARPRSLPAALVCLDIALLPPRAAGGMSPRGLLAHAARRGASLAAPLGAAMVALAAAALAANAAVPGASSIPHDTVDLDAGARLLRATLMPWAYAARCVPAALVR